ncbi:MAG: acyltransferase [Hyphomicrobiaceae bacterium]|nr:acyltransferase [Hyphomicrobiaceae bacterium]
MEGHRLSLDAMRGVAALIIVAFHRRWWIGDAQFLHSAYLAVDFFFCLSGVVIGMAYDHRLRTSMPLSTFAAVRLIRLYPMLLIGTLIGAVYFLASSSRTTGIDGASILSVGFALAIIPNIFNAASLFPVNGPVWSLFFELLVNLIYAACLRLGTPFRRVPLILGLLLLWLSFETPPEGVGKLGVSRAEFSGGFARAAFSFVFGVLIFQWQRDGVIPSWRVPLWLLLLVLAAVLCVDGSIVGARAYDLACVGIVFPLIVALGISSPPSEHMAKFAGFLGPMSYPLYATHYPMFDIFDRIFARADPTLPGPVKFAIALAFILTSNRFFLVHVDAPLRAWLSTRWRSRAINM